MERKEAIEVIKKNFPHVTESGTQFETALRTLIPELKESEDEKIRNWLIGYFNRNEVSKIIKTDDIIAWLEKQGEHDMGISGAVKQKLEDNLNKALEKETPESWNEFLDEQGEQKPIINVPSREVILSIWELGNEWKELTNCRVLTEYGTQLDYIQKHWRESEYSLREKQGEQEHTWSEDTQQWIDAIIKDYEGWYDADKDHRATIQVKINILKSLRPQN